MKKAKIITTEGVIDATDPKWFRFSSPPWLARYEFFTNRWLDPKLKVTKLFTVTEPKTGRSLGCGEGFNTRAQAKAFVKGRLIVAGPQQLSIAIKAWKL